MDHKLILENSNSAAAVDTLSNTIICLKAVKYFKYQIETDLLNGLQLMVGEKDKGSNVVLWLYGFA